MWLRQFHSHTQTQVRAVPALCLTMFVRRGHPVQLATCPLPLLRVCRTSHAAAALPHPRAGI